ncbi:hypothetical protein MKZ38_000310 [Zalerion maritima]|uniref:Uncharacterized protein n=1 Tax=Zalerion maritima TaxID=339359 RepID=A0AAD5RRR8_9PEZI|nr:hypothetical protein MKZ38_000310 [Zalerion maritima]
MASVTLPLTDTSVASIPYFTITLPLLPSSSAGHENQQAFRHWRSLFLRVMAALHSTPTATASSLASSSTSTVHSSQAQSPTTSPDSVSPYFHTFAQTSTHPRLGLLIEASLTSTLSWKLEQMGWSCLEADAWKLWDYVERYFGDAGWEASIMSARSDAMDHGETKVHRRRRQAHVHAEYGGSENLHDDEAVEDDNRTLTELPHISTLPSRMESSSTQDVNSRPPESRSRSRTRDERLERHRNRRAAAPAAVGKHEKRRSRPPSVESKRSTLASIFGGRFQDRYDDSTSTVSTTSKSRGGTSENHHGHGRSPLTPASRGRTRRPSEGSATTSLRIDSSNVSSSNSNTSRPTSSRGTGTGASRKTASCRPPSSSRPPSLYSQQQQQQNANSLKPSRRHRDSTGDVLFTPEEYAYHYRSKNLAAAAAAVGDRDSTATMHGCYTESPCSDTSPSHPESWRSTAYSVASSKYYDVSENT